MSLSKIFNTLKQDYCETYQRMDDAPVLSIAKVKAVMRAYFFPVTETAKIARMALGLNH